MVGVKSWARDEQGWLRELRFGLRATLGLGKKRARTFGKSRHGTHGNHRQTSLVVDSSSTMREDSATPTSGGEDSGTGYGVRGMITVKMSFMCHELKSRNECVLEF